MTKSKSHFAVQMNTAVLGLLFLFPGQDITVSAEERPSRAAGLRQQKSSEQQATSPQQQQEEEKCARLHTGGPLQIGVTWPDLSHPCPLLTKQSGPILLRHSPAVTVRRAGMALECGVSGFFFSFRNCKSKRIDAHPLSNNFLYRVIFLPAASKPTQLAFCATCCSGIDCSSVWDPLWSNTWNSWLDYKVKKNCLKKIK